MRAARVRVLQLASAVHLLVASAGSAQNAQFQAYFVSVCPTATGALLARCQQTPGGLGDLSSDSESSLNPNQLVALNDAALSRSQSTAREVQERLEAKRDEHQEAAAGGLGWSAYFHARGQFLDRSASATERGFEADAYGFHLGADKRLGASSVRYEVGLFAAGAPLTAAKGHFIHVYVDRQSRRPVALPPDLKTVLETLL